MSGEGLREDWLANWLITERVTGLGGSCIQLRLEVIRVLMALLS